MRHDTGWMAALPLIHSLDSQSGPGTFCRESVCPWLFPWRPWFLCCPSWHQDILHTSPAAAIPELVVLQLCNWVKYFNLPPLRETAILWLFGFNCTVCFPPGGGPGSCSRWRTWCLQHSDTPTSSDSLCRFLVVTHLQVWLLVSRPVGIFSSVSP